MDEQVLHKEMYRFFVVFAVVMPYWGLFAGITSWDWVFSLGFAALKVLQASAVVVFIYAFAQFDSRPALTVLLRGFLMTTALLVAYIVTMIIGAVGAKAVGL